MNDKDLKIYTVGIGTEKGGLVPVYDEKGEQKTGYKKDNTDNFVTSRLEADVLRSLADSGNGSYYQASLSSDDTAGLLKDIASLKRETSTTERIRRFSQLYQIFLGMGMILLLIAFLLPERSKTV
jgi:Ca-activated chloride channel family protein